MAEPTAAYLDCTGGVAGDMLLGALLDAGAGLEVVQAGVRSLGIPGL
ncbi:MAG: nickel insertion protein, partial [Pseudonocardiaceae bacterium]